MRHRVDSSVRLSARLITGRSAVQIRVDPSRGGFGRPRNGAPPQPILTGLTLLRRESLSYIGLIMRRAGVARCVTTVERPRDAATLPSRSPTNRTADDC